MKILVAFCVCGTYYVIGKAKFRCYEKEKIRTNGTYRLGRQNMVGGFR